MERIMNFMKNAEISYLATSSNNKPKIRIMSSLMEIDGKLCFLTNRSRGLYFDLQENRHIEIVAVFNEMTLTITGPVIETTTAQMRKVAISSFPSVAKLYGGTEDDISIFSFKHADAVFTDFSGNKETLKIGE